MKKKIVCCLILFIFPEFTREQNLLASVRSIVRWNSQIQNYLAS